MGRAPDLAKNNNKEPKFRPVIKLTMTLTKKKSKPERGLLMLLVIFVALSLSACGGAKKIATKDDSADYKSAQALPPLKKPSRAVAAAAVETNVEAGAEPSIESAEPEEATTQDLAAANTTISASVVNGNSGQARLEVAADFDRAWDYLSSNLQKSDLTVFSRNKEAGSFSIGCANIAAAPTVTKSSRWSFFNRGKQQNFEYCALQLVEKRGTTIVSFLNRAGEEVSGEYSNEVFSRILNN